MLSRKSVTDEHVLKSNSYYNKTETLNQPIPTSPMIYTPSFIVTNTPGQPGSYQNIFLNFVATNVPPTPNQSVLMNVVPQPRYAPTENDAILKQLLESKKPEELSCDIDPNLYSFEHFLVAPTTQIKTPNIECKQCGVSYVTIKLLRKHFDDVHGGNLPYMCTFCFSKFLFKDHYDKHMHNHLDSFGENLAESTVTLKSIAKNSQARMHGNIIDEHKCEKCSHVFYSEESLCNHLKVIHGIDQIDSVKLVTCKQCKREFSTETHLEQHMKVHQRRNKEVKKVAVKVKRKDSDNSEGEVQLVESTIVVEDSSTVDEKENIVNHRVNDESENRVENNNNDGNNEVNNSGEASRNEAGVSEFITNNPDGKWSCNFCQKQFVRSHDLRRHMKNIHIKSSLQLQCHLCNDYFYEGFKLTRHLKGHYSSLSCSECKRLCSNISEMTDHMMNAHKGMKNINCNVCYLSFDNLLGLEEHLENHFMEIIYKCHVCEEKFGDCRDLTRHVSEHSGKRTCDNCNRTFYKEEEFQSHKGECDLGRYKCEVCPRAFKKRRYLKSHIKAKHSDEICVDESPQKKKCKIDNGDN